MRMTNGSAELTQRHVCQEYSPSLTKQKKKTGGVMEVLRVGESLSGKYSVKATE